jgi:Tol biopolymer transport system component
MRVHPLAFLAAATLGCGGDDVEPRRIGSAEVVHEYRPPGIERAQLGVSRLGGPQVEQLTALTDRANFPSVSPDGSLVVFGQLSRLYLYDVATGSVRQLTFGPASDGGTRWSPDGTIIVYGSRRFADPATSDICTMPVTGGSPTCLTPPDEYDDRGPDWSPDGSEIVWERDLDGFIDLWIMNADGTNQRLLLDHSDYDTLPQWSPDGRFILFRSWRYGPPCLFILERATGNVRPVLGDSLDPAYIETGTWTPDGTGVVIEVLSPNNRLALVDLATGDARFLNSDTTSYYSWPSMVRNR